MAAESEINGISKELSVEDFESNLVNNVILKVEEFDELSRRNVGPRYVPIR